MHLICKNSPLRFKTHGDYGSISSYWHYRSIRIVKYCIANICLYTHIRHHFFLYIVITFETLWSSLSREYQPFNFPIIRALNKCFDAV